MCRTLHLYVQTKTLKNGQNAEIHIGLHYDVKTVERYHRQTVSKTHKRYPCSPMDYLPCFSSNFNFPFKLTCLFRV